MKLWVRWLSCGHSRDTGLSYSLDSETKKPKKGDSCYCRQCCNEVEVLSVQEGDKQDYEDANFWKKEFKKMGEKK